jgi:hypothetical protein
MLARQKEVPLIVRDNGEECDVFVYVKARDGTDQMRVLPAHGRTPSHLTFCVDHFIARGVCVTCSQELGHIVYAS